MAEVKTKPSKDSVERFLNSVTDEQKRKDSFALLQLMKQITKQEPVMWGNSIVGFGTYHYKYASGREGDWLLVGFSPRKQNLTLYFMSGFDQHANLLKRLGKHTTGKGCLYIKKLDDIDLPTLKQLIRQSIKQGSGSGK